MGLIFSLFLIGIVLAVSSMELARINREMVGHVASPLTAPTASLREAPAPTPDRIASIAAPPPANDEAASTKSDDGAKIKKGRSRRRLPSATETPPIDS